MKQAMFVIFSILMSSLPIAGSAAEEPKATLCTAKDVQHNIDILRESIGELKDTHDTNKGMQMLHDHMAVLIDNQEIMLGLLDKKDGVECPDKRAHIRK
jgi:hypothetical protein